MLKVYGFWFNSLSCLALELSAFIANALVSIGFLFFFVILTAGRISKDAMGILSCAQYGIFRKQWGLIH